LGYWPRVLLFRKLSDLPGNLTKSQRNKGKVLNVMYREITTGTGRSITIQRVRASRTRKRVFIIELAVAGVTYIFRDKDDCHAIYPRYLS
jgi:hypothetical protein